MAASNGGRRTLLIAILAALVCLVLAGAAGFYLRKSGALQGSGNPDRVAVVFASQDASGAQVAQVVALVTNGHDVRFIDPETTVTIPGTSYSMLKDAYSFGGGRAVASALGPLVGGSTAYVEIPEQTWAALLDGSTITVSLPKPLRVFDGRRLVSFHEGTSTVAAADVPSILLGAPFLDTASRVALLGTIGGASLRAIGPRQDALVLRTDLRPQDLKNLLAKMQTR